MKSKINVEAICFIDNKIWYSSMRKNGLYCYDCISGKNELIALFQDELPYTYRLHCRAIYINERVYFIPDNAKKISVYEPVTNKIMYIENVILSENRYSTAAIYDNLIYMFPRKLSSKIMILNTNDNSFSDLELPVELEKDIFAAEYVREDNTLFFACWNSGRIYSIDLSSKQQNVISLEMDSSGFSCILMEQNELWVASHDRISCYSRTEDSFVIKKNINFECVFRHRNENGNIQYINNSSVIKSERIYPFQIGYMDRNSIYFFSRNAKEDIVIDRKEYSIRKYCIDEEENMSIEENRNINEEIHYLAHSEGSKLFLTSLLTKNNYLFDCGNPKKIVLKEGKFDDIIFREKGAVICEEEITDLSVFIDNVTNSNRMNNMIQ